MARLLLIVVITLMLRSSEFKLADDMSKDRERILTEHAGADQLKQVRFDLFKSFVKLNLSRFHYSRKRTGGFAIDKWKEPKNGGLTIYQAAAVIPVDTIEDGNPIYINGKPTGQTEKLHVKKVFRFRIYIFYLANGQKLIYETEERQGLYEVIVGDKNFPVLYEDTPLGIRFPDLVALLKITEHF